MKLFRFDREVSDEIGAYGSSALFMSRIVRPYGNVRVDVMHLGPDGKVGGHHATCNQIFAVVAGQGWARAEDGEEALLSTGQAAFWTSGEWHESGTAHGMTVIVIEGPDLDPTGTMSPLNTGEEP